MSTPATQVFVGTTQTNVVTVQTPGPQGPTGPLGNNGPTGPAGGPTGPTGPFAPPAPPAFNNVVAATIPSGTNDNFSPFGYVPGVTNLLRLTPTDVTSTIIGLSAAGIATGFSMLLVNASATTAISLLSQASGTAANNFVGQFGSNQFLPPLAQTIIVYVVGLGWFVDASYTSTQLITGSGTGGVIVNPGYYEAQVVLDGVSTTFAVTFPVAFADQQIVEVLFNTAISVAFSVTGSGDGSTVNNVPATASAGMGIAWQYMAAITTWYRLY